MRIYLTGFMTSGKSTIGPILANVLGLEFYDLDCQIEQREGRKVVRIFEESGESYFRKLESQVLNEIAALDNVVIALGGGTIVNPLNYEMMKKTGKVIYLKVSPETLYNRLKHKTDRPIFKDLVVKEKNEQEFLERINELLEKRKDIYEKADLIIDTETTQFGRTIDRIAKKIIFLFHEKN
jgi:shikimate kinase